MGYYSDMMRDMRNSRIQNCLFIEFNNSYSSVNYKEFLKDNKDSNLLVLYINKDAENIIVKGILTKVNDKYILMNKKGDIKDYKNPNVVDYFYHIYLPIPKTKDYLDIIKEDITMEFYDGTISFNISSKLYSCKFTTHNLSYGDAINLIRNENKIISDGDKYLFSIKRQVLNKEFELVVQYTKSQKYITEYKPDSEDLYKLWRLVSPNELETINKEITNISITSIVKRLKENYGYKKREDVENV